MPLVQDSNQVEEVLLGMLVVMDKKEMLDMLMRMAKKGMLAVTGKKAMLETFKKA